MSPSAGRPARSVSQHAQAVQLVVDLVSVQVRLDVLPDLLGLDRTADVPLAQAIHLAGANVGELFRRFLLLVDAERAEEARQADEPRAGLAEPEQQIPVTG